MATRAAHRRLRNHARLGNGGGHHSVSTGGPVKDGAKITLIVFSHGLAGHRSMYAVLCSALASQGYIVAAMEHRDGSASCASVVDADGAVRHKAYVHTEPPNFDWRREQIVVRTREIDAAIAALSSQTPPKNVFPGSTFDASTPCEARLMSRGSLRWVTLSAAPPSSPRCGATPPSNVSSCGYGWNPSARARRGSKGRRIRRTAAAARVANVRDELASAGARIFERFIGTPTRRGWVRSRRHETPGFQRFAVQVALFGESWV